jgi:hypothetical protein
MAVTANQLRPKCQNPGGLRHCGVLNAKNLYSGTLAFYDATTGYLTDDDAAGANKFAGIIENQADNSSGAAGAINAEFWTSGSFELTGSGFTQADVGKPIHASDNYTITTTTASTSRVGTCDGFVSATKLNVRLVQDV